MNSFRLLVKARMVRTGCNRAELELGAVGGRFELTPISSRDNSDDHRPRPNENVSKGGANSGLVTAVVLNDVGPVTCNNEFWGRKGDRVKLSSWGQNQNQIAPTQTHIQHGNSDCDQ